MTSLNAMMAIRIGAQLALAAGLALGLCATAMSQTAAPPAPDATTPAPVIPAQPPAPTAPVAPPAVAPAEPDAKPSGDASSAQVIQLEARPVALIRGKSRWDDGFKTINAALAKIDAEIKLAGLKTNGKPLTVFLETDDESFRFEAMVPLAEMPVGKDQLSTEVKLGKSPTGKAIKFQHRAAYEEIDSTYEAITAYLDEKGLEAQNLFIEEYLTDTKSPDDAALEVDIYVFVQ